MGRVLGYMANRRDRLLDVLEEERAVIEAASSDGPAAGWGIGFYQAGEVLHKKRPLRDGETPDWEALAKDVRSDCVIAQLRQPTVGDFRVENMHPFRMRSWLFAHAGTIRRFEAMRERLLGSLPDFLRRNIRGQTDSEAFFHAILSFLHDARQLDNPDVDDEVVVRAIRSAVALVDRLSDEVDAGRASLNLVLTNGDRLYALRRGPPLVYVARQGLSGPVDASLPDKPSAPSVLRYVLVVSGGETTPSGYSVVEDGSVIVVDRDLRVTAHAV